MDSQARDLDGIFDGDELQKLEGDSVSGTLEVAVPLAVADDVVPESSRMGRGVGVHSSPVSSSRRRRPPRPDRSQGRSTRRQLVLTAVRGTGGTGAGLRDLESEIRVGHDVHPRRGSPLAFPETVTYSDPSAAKPPRPLKNSSLGTAGLLALRASGLARRRARGAPVPDAAMRTSCSARFRCGR